MNFVFSSISKVGPRRVNEDSLDCWVAKSGETIACVADGLGGMGGGDVASRLAVTEFKRYLTKHGTSRESILEAANSAHRRICEKQLSGGKHSQMATTLTAVSLSDGELIGVHCGDSRAMIERNEEIKQLTTDHTEGERLFAAGKISESELMNYERKHILDSALGVPEGPRLDLFRHDLLPGDRILLTTDGIHNLAHLLDLRSVSSIANSPYELVAWVDEMIEDRGPIDNYSMIAVFWEVLD